MTYYGGNPMKVRLQNAKQKPMSAVEIERYRYPLHCHDFLLYNLHSCRHGTEAYGSDFFYVIQLSNHLLLKQVQVIDGKGLISCYHYCLLIVVKFAIVKQINFYLNFLLVFFLILFYDCYLYPLFLLSLIFCLAGFQNHAF